MENATKALMIAAAVLVVMLIIALGIGVFSTASEQVDNAGNLSEYQIQQFNDKFRKYEGTKSGSEVNAMINTVFNHNNSQDDTSTMVEIIDSTSANKADLAPASYDKTKSPGTLPTGAKYKVTAQYEDNLIKSLTIEDV